MAELLDRAFADFIDENATGIGLPPSERLRRQRRHPTPFELAVAALRAGFEEFARRIGEAFLPPLRKLARALTDLTLDGDEQ